MDSLAAGYACDRCQIENRPAAASDHCGNRMLDAKEHTGRIDRHDAVPTGSAVQVLFRAPGHPGIVDQYIQLAESPRAASHTDLPVLLVRYIERFEMRGVADALGNLLA